MKLSMRLISILTIAAVLFLQGCGNKEEDKKDFVTVSEMKLTAQNNRHVTFPEDFEGKVLVINFMFLNCPDICPMTTNSMRMIQEEAVKRGIKNLHFLSITFDPERDTVSALRDYARIREYDLSNWHYLTGKRSDINALMKDFGIVAVSGDTTYAASGMPIYFYTHTDRITVVDKQLKIRKHYKGSEIDFPNLIKDIKVISEE